MGTKREAKEECAKNLTHDETIDNETSRKNYILKLLIVLFLNIRALL